MKPEQSERILVEELFKKTITKNLLSDDVIENIEHRQRPLRGIEKNDEYGDFGGFALSKQ